MKHLLPILFVFIFGSNVLGQKQKPTPQPSPAAGERGVVDLTITRKTANGRTGVLNDKGKFVSPPAKAQPKPFISWLPSEQCKVCSEETIEGVKYRVISDEFVSLAFHISIEEDYFVATARLTNKGEPFAFDPLKHTGLLAFKTEKGYFDRTEKPEVFSPVEASEIEKSLRYGNAGVNLAETSSAPDTQAKEQAERQSIKNNEYTARARNTVIDSALKSKTLSTNDKIAGNIYYPKKKKPEVVTFNFGLHGRIYSFTYLVGKDKK